MTSNDSKLHTRSIYIDVELSFWAGPPPRGMRQEIIEIAMVEMDLQTTKITREAVHFVRPGRWEISARCTRLTGITANDIRKARPFPDVLASLTEEFAPGEALCCAWGNDAALIAGACQSHGLKTPLRSTLDLADLYHRLFLGKHGVSLFSAVEALGLKFEGVPHGALADARNTALVHAAVIRRMRRQLDPSPHHPKAPESPAQTLFGQRLREALGIVEVTKSGGKSERQLAELPPLPNDMSPTRYETTEEER